MARISYQILFFPPSGYSSGPPASSRRLFKHFQPTVMLSVPNAVTLRPVTESPLDSFFRLPQVAEENTLRPMDVADRREPYNETKK